MNHSSNKVSSLAFTLVFVLSFQFLAGSQQTGIWTQTNGPLGGLINAVAIDPSNPQIIFAGTYLYGTEPASGNGIYKSTDGGVTWSEANGLNENLGEAAINGIHINPMDSNIILVASVTSGIYLSEDGGSTWAQTYTGSVSGLDISVSNSDIVYAMEFISGSIRILKSQDAGQSWTATGSVPGGDRGCRACRNNPIAVHPENPDVIFAGTSDGVFKSTDGGNSWIRANEGMSRLDVVSILINPDKPETLFALTGQFDLRLNDEDVCLSADESNDQECGGVYRSINGGESWDPVFVGLFDPLGDELAFSITNPEHVFAAISHRLYGSFDGGDTWRLLYGIAPGSPIKYIGTDDNVSAVSVFDETQTYAGLWGGLIRSETGGQTWHWSQEGIQSHQLYALEVAPDNPLVAYSGSFAGGGVYRTVDGGQNWETIVRGFDDAYIMQIAINPDDAQNVFVTTTRGLYITYNGGKSWDHIDQDYFGYGHGHSHLHGLGIDPTSPDVIYVGGGGDRYAPEARGLYKSTDGGETWFDINNGFATDVHVSWIVVDPLNSNTVYVATQGFVEGWTRIGNGSGIFKSEDAGESWNRVNNGLGSLEISALAINPIDSEILFAGDEFGNLYRSSNAGQSWNFLKNIEAEVGRILIDPNNPMIIFASAGKEKSFHGTLGTGVWRSEDGGDSWVQINSGLDYLQIHSIALHGESGVMYAASSGGGVYRLGDPGPLPTETPTPTNRATQTAVATATEAQPVATSTPNVSEQQPGNNTVISLTVAAVLVGVGLWIYRNRQT